MTVSALIAAAVREGFPVQGRTVSQLREWVSNGRFPAYTPDDVRFHFTGRTATVVSIAKDA